MNGIPSLLFALQCSMLWIAAFALARKLFEGQEAWRQVIGALVLVPAVTYISVMPLAIASNLSVSTSLMTLGIISAAAFWVNDRTRSVTQPELGRVRAIPFQQFFSPIVAVAIVAAHSVSRVRLGTPFGSDDLNYSASFAGHLIANKGLSWEPNTYQIHYPYNTEIFSAWLMLPSGDDRFVYLASIFWFFLAVAAVVSICCAISDRSNGSTIAFFVGALFATSPVVWYQAGSFAPVDLATAGLLLAAIALASPHQHSTDRLKHSFTDAVAVGITTGLAIGGKITALPAALVLWVYMIALRSRLPSGRLVIRNIVALFGPVLIFGSFWYVRNWTATGNPLFPAEIAVFSGPFDATAMARTTLGWWLERGYLDLDQWRYLVGGYLNWPAPLAVTALLGFIIAALRFFQARQRISTQNHDVIWLLIVCGLIFFALWPKSPFSGTVNAPDADLVILKGRLIFLFAVGLCLFGAAGALFAQRAPARAVWWMWAILALSISQPPRINLVLSCGLAAFLGVFLLRRASPGTNAWISRASVVLPIIAIVGIGALSERAKALADRNLWALGDEYHLSPAWQEVDKLQGARITSYGVRSLWYYPLFGRSLQNVPVYVNRHGNGRAPMHEEWELGTFYWWQAHEEWLNPDPDLSGPSLLRNLRDTGVEYVLFGFREDFSPQQYELLKGLPGITTVYTGEHSALLDVRFRETHESLVPKGPRTASVP